MNVLMKTQTYNNYNHDSVIKNIKNFVSYLNEFPYNGSDVLHLMQSARKFSMYFSLSHKGVELLIEVIKSSPQFFKELDFTRQAFNGDHANIIFQLLSDNNCLRSLSLDLNRRKLNDSALQSLTYLINNNSNIKEIELKLPTIDDRAIELFETLTTSKRLQSLRLSCKNLNCDALEYIAKITNLKKLDLSYNTLDFNATTAFIHLLEKMTSLCDIKISYFNLDYSAIEKLAPTIGVLANLKTLNMDSCSLDSKKIIAFTPLLEKMTDLKELYISYNSLNLDATRALAPFISKMVNLKNLHISGLFLGHDSIKELTSSMSAMTNLQELDLRFYDNDLYPIELFAPLLNIMINLQSLNLSYNHLNFATIAAFLPALSKMINFRILILSNNNLGCDTIEILAPCIDRMINFQILDLSDNSLDNKAIKILAPYIGKMINLQSLDLSGNSFDSNSFEILSPYLNKLTSLVKLGIGSKHLPFAKSPSLIEFISDNNTITILVTYIGKFSKTISSINKMVDRNFSLIYLDLRECKKGEHSKLLEHMIIRNRLIQDDAQKITELLNVNYEQKHNHTDIITINADKMLGKFLDLDCTRKLQHIQYVQMTSKPALIHLFHKEEKNGILWLARLEDMVGAKFFYLKRVCKEFVVRKDFDKIDEIREKIFVPEIILKHIVSFLGRKSLSHHISINVSRKHLEDDHTSLTQEALDAEGVNAVVVKSFMPNNLNEQNLSGIQEYHDSN